jgi:trimeric autotransporter adhesin
VTMTAIPETGANFTSWSGNCSGLTPVCSLTMNGAKNVGATFKWPLTVNITGGKGGTVTSAPPGITACAASCTANFDQNVSVTLTASPGAGNAFEGWSGACSGTETTCTVTMNAAKTVVATFKLPLNLTITAPSGGTVSSNPLGINSCAGGVCSALFATNSDVTLTAAPSAGNAFGEWGGCTSTLNNTCTVHMDGVKNVTATFKIPLTVSIVGNTGGTVTSDPAGISNCANSCMAPFNAGSEVTLTASASQGSSFSSWINCAQVPGSPEKCKVTMDSAKVVSATFKVRLTVEFRGKGNGTKVTNSLTGTECGDTCDLEFPVNSLVTLTATPGTNIEFGNWASCDTSAGTNCDVRMTGPRRAIATFRLPVNVSVVGLSGGGVTLNPGGHLCPTDCTPLFDGASTDHASTAQLIANPKPGATFAWAGNCQGVSSTTCSLTMDQPKSAQITYKFPVIGHVTGGKGGRIEIGPNRVNCAVASCPAIYFQADSDVTLKAIPASGASFGSWSGCTSASGNICTVAMNDVKNVTATFTFKLTMHISPSGSGSVTSLPEINCPGSCSHDYDADSTVTLNAIPGSGKVFDKWTGACSGSTPTCTVTMSAAKDVTATFKNVPPTPTP